MELNMSEENNQIPKDKEVLERLLEGVVEHYASSDLHRSIQINNQKLIDCRHEIIMAITAYVYAQDDSGQDVAAEEICRKNFHIPVPANKDYHDYMKNFFMFLETCLSSSIEKTDQKVQDNE